MDVDDRLRERALDQQTGRCSRALPAAHRQSVDAKMLAHIPFRKQVQLAPQQRLVVGRQRRRPGRELPA